MIFNKYLKNTEIKLIAILVTGFIIVAILVQQNHGFKPLEKPFPLFQLDEKAKAKTSLVEIGLHINDFPIFSFTKKTFLLDGIVWFKFPSGSESMSGIEDFSLYNSLASETGVLHYKSSPIVKLIGDDVLISYHFQTTFYNSPEHKNFPFADHVLSLVILNKQATPYELYFTSDENNFTFDEKTTFGTWNAGKIIVRTGYVKSNLLSSGPALNIAYPATEFSVEFNNVGVRDLISLYFPMFVLFFIVLFSLLIKIDDSARFGYVTAAVPGFVLFRLVIDGASPEVGYTTHVDFVYYVLVFLSLLILFFQVYTILRLEHTGASPLEIQEKTKHNLEKLNDKVFFSSLLLLLVLIIYTYFR